MKSRYKKVYEPAQNETAYVYAVLEARGGYYDGAMTTQAGVRKKNVIGGKPHYEQIAVTVYYHGGKHKEKVWGNSQIDRVLEYALGTNYKPVKHGGKRHEFLERKWKLGKI